MTSSRDQLIQKLRDDNRGGVRPFLPLRAAWLWNLVAWTTAILATVWVQALRPGWFTQMWQHPQFAVETLAGLFAILLSSLLVFRLGVPASRRGWLLTLVIVSTTLWILSFIVGLIHPALEPSMAGKREFCRYEILVYALVPLIAGVFGLQRAYVFNWTISTMMLGFVSAMIPAWLMQFACMYDPWHILTAHVAPIAVVAAFGAAIGWLLQGRRG